MRTCVCQFVGQTMARHLTPKQHPFEATLTAIHSLGGGGSSPQHYCCTLYNNNKYNNHSNNNNNL